ncbi:hypothetical protein [Sphingomonas oryzagri]|uniref:Uncharacterized protein n=1 Tax=Sphingomonas oryzagri TaxID=3042314 RepID=A0ABT6N1K4_9SPHN|nr:hypothetical protein [Sphingomonas oryzagri]MDH7638968.1 hypothetical protein [Sphingomonas oryzagri]
MIVIIQHGNSLGVGRTVSPATQIQVPMFSKTPVPGGIRAGE